MKISIFSVILFLLSTSVYSTQLWVKPDGTVLSAPRVDEYGNIKVDAASNSVWDVLQPYTTAAFTIYLTSVNATGTTTGKFTMYESTFTLEQLNSGGGATTNYFNVLLSTSDTIFDIVNRINEISNWTSVISPGCYGLALATGSASVRIDGEGTTDGLQYDAPGKSVTFSTGSANTITIFFNGTRYIVYRKEPVTDKSHYLGRLEGNPTFATTGTGTIIAYEGNVSSACTTQLNVPVTITATDVRAGVNYTDPFNIIGTIDWAQEYRLYGSTWITGGFLGIGGKTAK